MGAVRNGTQGKVPFPILAAGGLVVALLVLGILVFLPNDRQRPVAPPSEVAAAEAADPEADRGDVAPAEAVGADEPMREAVATAGGGSVEVYGLVTAADSEGAVSGARIEVEGETRGRGGTGVLASAEAGGSGAYSLEVLRGDLPHRSIVVTARAQGYAPERQVVSLPRVGRRVEANFTLAPGAPLRGVVLGRNEQPVPRARVGILVASDHPSSPVSDPYATFPTVEADEQGRFEIEAAPKGKPVLLYARHRAHIPGVAEVDAREEGREWEVVLALGEASIRGRVIDARGRPSPSTAVQTTFRPGGRGWRGDVAFPDLDTQFAYTDETGYFEFPAVRAGWQTLVASSATPMEHSTGQSVLFDMGEEKTVTLKFDPALTVQGIVVDSATEEPIRGVSIARPDGRTSPPLPGESVDSVVTGADGRFVVETYSRVANGFHRVPDLYYRLPHEFGIDAEEWKSQALRADRLREGEEVRIEVVPSLLLEGIVYLADGETPAPGVGLDFRPQFQRARGIQLMPDPDVASAQTQSDARGHFRMRVPPSTNGFLLARGDAGYASLSFESPVAGPLDPVEVVLEGFSSVSGTVTGPDGEGVADARVTIRQAAGARGTAYTGTTEADGTYVIREVYGTRAFANVEAPEGALLSAPDARLISVEPGEDLAGVDFQFARAVHFEGTVVNEEGRPIARAQVTRMAGRWANPGTPTAETDEEGRFAFTDLAEDADVFTLVARHPGHDDATKEGLFADDSPVVLTMRPRSSVSLTAWTAGGEQVTSYEYQFTLTRESRSRDRRGMVEGRAILQEEPVREVLSPGVYRAHVYALAETGERTGAYGFEEIEIVEGAPSLEVRVGLGDALRLRGTVVDENDRGIGEVEVRLLNMEEARGGPQWGRGQGGGPAMRTAMTDGSGSFEFDYVTPGEIRLEGRKEDLVQAEDVEMTLEAGRQPDSVTIRMNSGARISGVVTGIDGRPAGGMTVRLGTGWRSPTERTERDGAYEFVNVPPGQHTVMLLSSSGAEIDRESVSITGMEQKEVDFSLEGLVQVSGTVTRNGQRDRSRAFVLELVPIEGTLSSEATVIADRGQYEQYLHPGAYSVEIPVPGGGGRSITGAVVTVDERPASQTADIQLDLVNVGIVIVDLTGEDFAPGTLRYEHRARRQEGSPVNVLEVPANQTLFYLDNQPAGEARGVFTTANGVEFVSPWTRVGDGQENILTLLASDR